MSKINLNKVKTFIGRYPKEIEKLTKGISKKCQVQKVGDAANLKQFGVNKVVLPPGEKTSIRHWHDNQDEFIIILSGQVSLIDDSGEHLMKSGDVAGFKSGDRNGHHFCNKSNENVILFEIGSRIENEIVCYSDFDLMVKIDKEGKAIYSTKEGKIIVKS